MGFLNQKQQRPTNDFLHSVIRGLDFTSQYNIARGI